MNAADVIDIIAALTTLVVAIGTLIGALKLLREVKTGNALTQDGLDKTDAVLHQGNSAKHAADRYQQDLRAALNNAGVEIPGDQSLEKRNGR